LARPTQLNDPERRDHMPVVEQPADGSERHRRAISPDLELGVGLARLGLARVEELARVRVRVRVRVVRVRG
jgi:hypothetical protein